MSDFDLKVTVSSAYKLNKLEQYLTSLQITI